MMCGAQLPALEPPLTESRCSAAVQLASLLGAELGMALPSTLAFDFPTVNAITAFVSATPDEVRGRPALITSGCLRTSDLMVQVTVRAEAASMSLLRFVGDWCALP